MVRHNLAFFSFSDHETILEATDALSVKGVPLSPTQQIEKENNEQTADNKGAPLNESASTTSKNKILDEAVLRILGKDPSDPDKNLTEIHEILVPRWSNWLAEGLKKEEKEELLARYPEAKNCQIKGQILNPAVEEIMTQSAKKRDGFSKDLQDMAGSALSAVSSAMSLILDETEEGIDGDVILQHLIDAGRLLCEIHHHEAITRRTFIIPGVDKSMKPVLESSKIDKFLFGERLLEQVSLKKNLTKVASDLKPKPLLKPAPPKQNHLNWSAPPSNKQKLKEGQQRRFSTQKFRKTQASTKNHSDQKAPLQSYQKPTFSKNQAGR